MRDSGKISLLRTAFRLTLRTLGLAGLVLAVPLAALGQTAGEITEPSYTPPAQRLTGALVFSGAPGLAAPPGSEKLSIQLSAVEISGALPGTGDLVAQIRKRLTRGRIAVSEIFAAASELEAAFAREGYVLSRVVLPAQTLVDGGKLKLSVVNGFVENIDTANVPAELRRRLELLTRPLIGKRDLRLDEIERRLLLAGDTYGIALGSALATGATPGGTIIVLDPAYRKVTGFLGFDNGYSDQLGNLSLGGGVELNGLLGRGEVIYLRASGHPELGGDRGYFSSTPRLRTLAAGAVVPIGGDGLTFNVEYTNSRTRPDTGGFDSASDYQRLSARLFYPIRRSGKVNLSAQFAFDAVTDRLDLVTPFGNLPISEDRLRVLRVSGDGTWVLDNGGVLELGAILSFGIDGLGARSAADATPVLPLSRAGADAEFQKLELSARYRGNLGEKFTFSLAGRAQTAFGDALPSSEQFGIATVGDMSPFDQGDLSGDSGWILRAELSRPVDAELLKRPLVVRPYVFGAAGEVNHAVPAPGEAARIGSTAYGLGVEFSLIRDPKFSSASLRVEYGEGQRDDGNPDVSRLTIVGTYRF